jgi:hypothetical protein
MCKLCRIYLHDYFDAFITDKKKKKYDLTDVFTELLILKEYMTTDRMKCFRFYIPQNIATNPPALSEYIFNEIKKKFPEIENTLDFLHMFCVESGFCKDSVFTDFMETKLFTLLDNLESIHTDHSVKRTYTYFNPTSSPSPSPLPSPSPSPSPKPINTSLASSVSTSPYKFRRGPRAAARARSKAIKAARLAKAEEAAKSSNQGVLKIVIPPSKYDSDEYNGLYS